MADRAMASRRLSPTMIGALCRIAMGHSMFVRRDTAYALIARGFALEDTSTSSRTTYTLTAAGRGALDDAERDPL